MWRQEWHSSDTPGRGENDTKFVSGPWSVVSSKRRAGDEQWRNDKCEMINAKRRHGSTLEHDMRAMGEARFGGRALRLMCLKKWRRNLRSRNVRIRRGKRGSAGGNGAPRGPAQAHDGPKEREKKCRSGRLVNWPAAMNYGNRIALLAKAQLSN